MTECSVASSWASVHSKAKRSLLVSPEEPGLVIGWIPPAAVDRVDTSGPRVIALGALHSAPSSQLPVLGSRLSDCPQLQAIGFTLYTFRCFVDPSSIVLGPNTQAPSYHVEKSGAKCKAKWLSKPMNLVFYQRERIYT